METPRRHTSSRNQGKRIAAGLAAVLVLVALLWWSSAQQMPTIVIPKPIMPTPNAFNTFNDATALQLDSGKVGFAIGTKHSGIKDDRDYSWTEKEKLVSENAPALALLREGLDQEYMNPPARSWNALFPYYAQYRSMARLLALDSSVKEHKGDYSGAARSSMDAMELGEEVPHGSTLIGGLVGIACSAIGRRPMWRYLDKLNAEQAQAAVKRLERIRAKEVPFSTTMQEEKWAIQASLLEAMRSPNGLGAMSQSLGIPAPAFTNSLLFSHLFYMVYSKRQVMNDFTTYWDACIARTKLPYGTTKPVPVPKDPVVYMVVPLYEQAQLKFMGKQTNNALLETSLALRAFRVQHGKYPASLDELTPSLLPHLPADPFAQGMPLRYRLTNDGYVLYSIGPDGRDDGGTPIDTGASRASNPNERYFVKQDSKGDIVAGKNIY